MSDIIAQSPRDLQNRASRLVDREVYCCMSSLVSTLAEAYGTIDATKGDHSRDLCGLVDQAWELAAPVLDYENAARSTGIELQETEDGFRVMIKGMRHSWHNNAESAWQAACDAESIDPDEIEIYEHWAISDWLADKLEAKGERIDRDFAGLIVWGRTATGQSITMDNVIQEIVSETGYASGV